MEGDNVLMIMHACVISGFHVQFRISWYCDCFNAKRL